MLQDCDLTGHESVIGVLEDSVSTGQLPSDHLRPLTILGTTHGEELVSGVAFVSQYPTPETGVDKH